jgi:hypothetical protein
VSDLIPNVEVTRFDGTCKPKKECKRKKYGMWPWFLTEVAVNPFRDLATLLVKVIVAVWPLESSSSRSDNNNSLPLQLQEGDNTREKEEEDLHNDMLDNFADLSAASVHLEFADGEQRCHTFPLAARNVDGF